MLFVISLFCLKYLQKNKWHLFLQHRREGKRWNTLSYRNCSVWFWTFLNLFSCILMRPIVIRRVLRHRILSKMSFEIRTAGHSTCSNITLLKKPDIVYELHNKCNHKVPDHATRWASKCSSIFYMYHFLLRLMLKECFFYNILLSYLSYEMI